MTAEVAIVVPVHNGERTLARTLEDLRNQTFGDFIVIIAENASTDGTVAIARDFCSRDPRFRMEATSELLPMLENFTRAIRIGSSCGRYFMLRACDDTAEPEYLERLHAALDSNKAAMLAAGKTRLVGGSKGERYKEPNTNVLGFMARYQEGRIPRNTTFPAEWIYGLFRAEAADRLALRWPLLGTPWCAASFAVFDFVAHDEVIYVDNAVFEFVEGSGSVSRFGARSLPEKLRRRLDYAFGCFRLRHTLPPTGLYTTFKFLMMCWADSRRKTGYRLLGFF